MPFKPRSFSRDLDVRAIFDPSLLASEVAFENAFGVLESYLDDPTVNTESIIESLLSRANLFECVFSALDDVYSLKLQQYITDGFPVKADQYASSISSSLLARLSLSLLFVSFPSAPDVQEDLRMYRNVVEHAPILLATLYTTQFQDDAPVQDDDVPRKQSQRERKQRTKRAIVLDSKPFDMLSFDVPTSRAEADTLAAKILVEQKSILEYYLSILHMPTLKDTFKYIYIPQEPNAGVNDSAKTTSPDGTLRQEASVTDSLPAAYPMVQPMKAALYFESADGFGDWRILISTRADTDLRQARKKEMRLFKIIVKKIKELSMGHFSDDNHKRLTGPETDIPIYEAKMTRDSRLVYQIDCVAEFESHVERQVIKIFGIYTHAQLDRRFWDGVGFQLGRKGKEYKLRCTFRNKPRVPGDKVFAPASWPAPVESDATAWSSSIPDLHKDDLAKMHELLVLEKYVTFSQALLNSVLADKDVQHVFDISSQEMHIIEHPASCYVIGRSGTGKTTTMMFKMLGIERSAQSFGNTPVLFKPRQLFVTQSRVLAEKVEQFFTKLLGALNTSTLSANELRDLEAMKRTQQDRGLVDLDEEFAHRGDLPKRFSDLTEDHFPMFATFDQLCSLLEADLGVVHGKQLTANDTSEEGLLTTTDYMQQRRSAFVSFEVFRDSYWPHFPQSLTKGLDPSLVYGEFMGVIKGSEQTLDCEGGYLDKVTYVNYSHRQQATFSGKRETIYSLFEFYVKRRRERREYDAADRTHAILMKLRGGDLPGHQVDFIYVDEAQDNLLIDALILRTLCKNPGSGLFWAGDTAQTISIGSAFRFNDLKAFLHRVETRGRSPASVCVQQPASFQLAVNYRSHAGIVNCAHSIIELITRFWPNAIDTLAQEKGVIDGLKPVFFTGFDEDTVRYEQFLFGESGNQIEFGAEQCILVRDDAARDRLRAQVGEIGIIMTLYESKGLEFNDVLLYNFFEDSTVDVSQWRVVLNALEENIGVKPPRFDEVRHSSVCRELKFLYVASTRARMNLWLADGSDKAEPMRLFWTAKDLIKNCTPGSDVPRLAVTSTPEQWAATAKALFYRRRYAQAMHCYERASLPREKAACQAYWLREQASSVSRRDGKSQAAKYIEAATAFTESAQQATTEKLSYFRIAAECYRDGGDDGKAAEAYEKAHEFDLAAQHYRKVAMFDQAVAVIKSHRDAMDERIAENIEDVAKLFYLREHKLKQARGLFESDEEALEYMDDFGFDVGRASFLEQLNRPAEAAEIHLAEGRTLEAIQLFSNDKENAQSIVRASQCLLDALWSKFSFRVKLHSVPSELTDSTRGLIRLLNNFDTTKLDRKTCDELLMFRAIVSGDFAKLTEFGDRFYHLHEDSAAALICLDHVFSVISNLGLEGAPAIQVTRVLRLFILYSQSLQAFATHPSPCSSKIMQRLLGFKATSEDSYLLPKGTLLFNACDERSYSSRRLTEEGIAILHWDLEHLIRRSLCYRLLEQVRAENDLCRRVRVLQPCLPFVANRCIRSNCPQEHPRVLDVQGYNLNVRISVQQMLIYNTIFANEDYREQDKQRRYWVRQFYESLYPASYKLGSPHNLVSTMIPELREGIQVLNNWTRDQLVSLEPHGQDGLFLTSLVRTASLSYIFDPGFASEDIRSIRAVTSYRPEHLLRPAGAGASQLRVDDRRYVIYDILDFMKNDQNYSLITGVLFIRHIIEQRLLIDVRVLCDVMDRLCALLVVSNRNYHLTTPTLHEISLPRSWLVRILPGFDKLPRRDSSISIMISLYLRPIGVLLERTFTGIHAEHLLSESKDLAYLGWQHRSVFIHRICRNLCLLGYNIRHDTLRYEILRCITSIRKPDRRYDTLYSNYIHARTWNDLSRTVRASTIGSSLDEMIQVYDASKPRPGGSPLPNVRRMVYRSFGELAATLKAELPNLAPSTAPASDTVPMQVPPASVDEIDNTAPPEAEDEQIEGEPLDEPDEVEETGVEAVEQPVDSEGIPVSIEQPAMTSAEPTSEQLAAAYVVLTVYRQYRRRREFEMSRTRGMRARLHASCYDAAMAAEWRPKSKYRWLFLGAVPLLLVCLEFAREHLHEAKTRAKKRVKLVQHSELEKVKTDITTLGALLKQAIQLDKDLQAKSALHVRRDIKELMICADKVQQLVTLAVLPNDASLEWVHDLNIAIQSITRANAPQIAVKKVLKPDIVVDDDEREYY